MLFVIDYLHSYHSTTIFLFVYDKRGDKVTKTIIEILKKHSKFHFGG